MVEYKMSLSDLKKQLKDLRPKFGNTEDDLKKELDYHMRAKKAIENKERMDKVRAAKKSGTAPATASPAPIQKEKKEKTPKEKAPEEKISAKKAALMAQLAALGSD
jgi:hypothetical protein